MTHFLLSSTPAELHITTEAIRVSGVSVMLGNTSLHSSPASYLCFLPLLGIRED